ncbi:MAG: FAD-dependent oxidoreductase [Deltaproteobacteria bacterium]|nr:FAD-dependent oxidoreductase [Deltaproteobacteria bacterium]
MARIVVLGSGFAGNTAALNLKKALGRKHEVVVISPRKHFSYIPSWIWVGVGSMKPEKTQFDLTPVYEKFDIEFKNGAAEEIHPDDVDRYVVVKYNDGKTEQVKYDYLINATGPKLNFAATPGLGPDEGYSDSVCSLPHAVKTRDNFLKAVEKMKKGKRQKFVVGTGHGTATCQGAAFEYIHNLEFEIAKRGLRNMADITWISNEPTLGDFGVGGVVVRRNGNFISGKLFAESTFREKGIKWVDRAHVRNVKEGYLDYVNIEGKEGSLDFDFAMLIPPFAGISISYIDKDGSDIKSQMCVPSGFMKVDADYTSGAKPFEEWKNSDWPKKYNNSLYKNIFAAGIAFAPPHPISKAFKAPDGTLIAPSPPRTGMASGIIGHTVALSIIDMIKNGAAEPTYSASMAEFGAICITSMGKSMTGGSAALLTMYPVIPNYDKYKFGRNLNYTFGDIGLAGHWVKYMLHYLFIWKMKGKFLWQYIPD